MKSSLDPTMRAIAKAFGATVRSAALYLEAAGEPLTRRAALRRSEEMVRVHWGDEWLSLEGKTKLPGAISIGKPFSVIVEPAGMFEGLPVFGWDRMYKPEHSDVLRDPDTAARLKRLLAASSEATLVLTRDVVHFIARPPNDVQSLSALIDCFFDTVLALREPNV
jgi:hypothetical protein